MARRIGRQRAAFALWGLVALLGVGLLVFSQSGPSGSGDEGYHLVAAQLINAGRAPYVDFFYPQVPLYAYVNAGWMRVVGETWRSAHALSAVLTGASMALVAAFVRSRLRVLGWGVPGAMTAAFLMGLHYLVIRFGTTAQAYGLCLVLSVAAFRLVIGAAARPKGSLPFWAGLAAGAAAASSLLTAPVAPLLLLWLVWQERSGSWWKKGLQFLGGGTLPFLPLLWLAVRAPRRTLFSVFGYHLFHRWYDLPDQEITRQNLGVLAGWLTSPQDLLLALLAGVGLLFVAGRSGFDAQSRAEFYLCAWLAGGLGLYLVAPRPTYVNYYVLLIPFLSILAAAGLCAIRSEVWSRARPGWPVLAAIGLFIVGGAKTAYHERWHLQDNWADAEAIAGEVNRVTPRDGAVYADDDRVYFAAQRPPEPGLETSHTLHLPAALAASVGVASRSQLDQWLAAGRFATVVIDADLARVEALGLPRLYAGQKKLNDGAGYVFWERVPPSREPG